jgi:hypothetical protein
MSMSGIIIGAILGGTIGLGMVNVMAMIAKGKNLPCDHLRFPSSSGAVDTVAAWAGRHGYRLARTEGQTRVYKKGINFLTAPVFLESTDDGAEHQLKAYTQIDGLFTKGDLALTADGPIAKLPRGMAKKAVNELLASLQQPPLA